MSKPWIAHYEAFVPREFEAPETLLPAALAENARRFPDRTALVFFGRRISYRALDEAVDRFAAGLQLKGIRRGDRVAIYLPNCPQFVIAYYGALRAGAIAVPCNPLYVARELTHQLRDSGARVAVVLSRFYETLRSVRAETALEHLLVARIKDYFPAPLKLAFTLLREKKEGHRCALGAEPGTEWFSDFLARAPRSPDPVALQAEDTACLLYTGGTTGSPKGAELSHRNLAVNAWQCHVWFNTNIGQEIVPCALPFTHGYGMTTCLNYGLLSASTLLLIPDPRDLRYVLETISRERATFLPGVPTLFIALGNFKDVRRYDLSTVRACISGGATLTPEVKRRFEELTGGHVVEGYGLSEASPVTHANPVYSGCRVGTIGVPWPLVDCKIVSLEDGRTELPAGEAGELCVRGPQVMKGYWNRPLETAEVLRDGWLHTGDVAAMDADGYFRIVSRKKDLIIAGGYKIFPGEVEDVLHAHPDVREAVAVGVPHPYRGETVKVYVIAREGASVSEENLLQFCRERLARYKVPTAVELRQELPRTAIGKVLRRQLIEEEEARAAAQSVRRTSPEARPGT